MTLSSARAALAAFIDGQGAARARIEEAHRPVLELRDRLSAAKAVLVAIEGAVASLQASETANAIDCGQDFAGHASELSTLQARADRERRVVAELERRLAEEERRVSDLELSVSVSASAVEALVAAVMAEEAE